METVAVIAVQLWWRPLQWCSATIMETVAVHSWWRAGLLTASHFRTVKMHDSLYYGIMSLLKKDESMSYRKTREYYTRLWHPQRNPTPDTYKNFYSWSRTHRHICTAILLVSLLLAGNERNEVSALLRLLKASENHLGAGHVLYTNKMELVQISFFFWCMLVFFWGGCVVRVCVFLAAGIVKCLGFEICSHTYVRIVSSCVYAPVWSCMYAHVLACMCARA